MKIVSILGAGKLGTSLGRALSQKGYSIKAISCRTFSSAQESRQIIGEGIPLTDNMEAAKNSQIIILTPPDDKIKVIVNELASSQQHWLNKFVFHCSGLIPKSVLHPLRAKGAWISSIHPIQAFARKDTPPAAFKEIYFGTEATGQALNFSKEIVHALEGHMLQLKAEQKPFYHAACSMVSNFLIVLLNIGSSLLEQVDAIHEPSAKILVPLAKGTLQNVKKLNMSDALTGPVIRGDSHTIKKHLKALKEFPPYHELYLKLAKQALGLVQQSQELSPKKLKALRDLLGGK